MPCCKVQTCKNHTGRSTKNGAVKLFCFPKDRTVAERWLYLCRRADLKTSIARYNFTDSDRMCSIHFSADCFTHDKQTKTLFETGKVSKPPTLKLKPGSVPSLYLPLQESVVKTGRRFSEIRIAARDKEENRKRVSWLLFLFDFCQVGGVTANINFMQKAWHITWQCIPLLPYSARVNVDRGDWQAIRLQKKLSNRPHISRCWQKRNCLASKKIAHVIFPVNLLRLESVLLLQIQRRNFWSKEWRKIQFILANFAAVILKTWMKK